MTETPGWTLRVVNFLEKVLGSRNMCHHPDKSQNFDHYSYHRQRSTNVVYEVLVLTMSQKIISKC